VIPFQTYTMLMEFNPMDVVVPAGHEISVELTDTGADYLPSTCAAVGLNVFIDESSTLGLPLIDRPSDDNRWFLAPPWWDDPNNAVGL
jgi:hypothetical protein